MVPKHPKKQLNPAIKYAEENGFKVEEIHNGHTWGVAVCAPCGKAHRIWCTPKDPDVAAQQLRRFVDKHLSMHGKECE